MSSINSLCSLEDSEIISKVHVYSKHQLLNCFNTFTIKALLLLMVMIIPCSCFSTATQLDETFHQETTSECK